MTKRVHNILGKLPCRRYLDDYNLQTATCVAKIIKTMEKFDNFNVAYCLNNKLTFADFCEGEAVTGPHALPVFKTLEEAELFGRRCWIGFQNPGEPKNELSYLGLYDLDKIILRWASDAYLQEGITPWVDGYTIYASDKEIWERVSRLSELYSSEENTNQEWPDLYEYNNWRDLTQSLKSGWYKAYFNDNGESIHSVGRPVLEVCEDLTPSWEELKEVAFKKKPSLAKVNPCDWDEYHDWCNDIIIASDYDSNK